MYPTGSGPCQLRIRHAASSFPLRRQCPPEEPCPESADTRSDTSRSGACVHTIGNDQRNPAVVAPVEYFEWWSGSTMVALTRSPPFSGLGDAYSKAQSQGTEATALRTIGGTKRGQLQPGRGIGVSNASSSHALTADARTSLAVSRMPLEQLPNCAQRHMSAHVTHRAATADAPKRPLISTPPVTATIDVARPRTERDVSTAGDTGNTYAIAKPAAALRSRRAGFIIWLAHRNVCGCVGRWRRNIRWRMGRRH